MLPEILSNSLASLQAGRTRYTVSALHGVQRRGHPDRRKRFARSAIQVDHRFTYEQAHDGDEGARRPRIRASPPRSRAMLGRDARAGDDPPPPAVRARCARAEPARGRDRPGRSGRGHRRAPGRQRREPPGHRGVHARGQRGRRDRPDRAATIGFLRRAHPDPEPFKLDEFAEFARSLGPRASTSRRAGSSSSASSTETAGKPEEYAVHYGLLRSLKQADLHARARGALRPGQRGLLPLHLADPPLSRPAGPSPA